MTDKEKLIELLNSWGVEVTSLHNNFTGYESICITVPSIETMTNVRGYTGFETSFEFDPDGNFVNIGIWE